MVGGEIAGPSTFGIPSLPRQINFCGQIHVNPWLLIVLGHLDELNLDSLHQHFVVQTIRAKTLERGRYA
jgi:hypothetical protein